MRFRTRPIGFVVLGTIVALVLAILVPRMVRTKPPSGDTRSGIPGTSLTIAPSGSFRMLNATRGWALTGTAVMKTSDGGMSWNDVTPTGYKSPNGVAEYRGKRAAWVVGSGTQDRTMTVFRTNDSGGKWARAEVRTLSPDVVPRPVTIRFTDDKHGWLMAGFDVAAGSNPVGVYTTKDGGSTWQTATESPTGVSTPGSLPRGGIKSGLGARDSLNAWVSGLWYGEGIWLYATHNGGKTWQSVSVTVPTGFTASAGSAETRPPAFWGKRKGLLPVLYHQEKAILFYSTADGGRTWSPTTPLKTETLQISFVYSMLDSRHIFVSDGVKIYITSDGAKSWTTITPSVSLANLSQLGFVSPKLGWAAVGGKLLRTMDGGRRWIAPSR